MRIVVRDLDSIPSGLRCGRSSCCGKVSGGWASASGAVSSTLLLPAGDAAPWMQGCEMTTYRYYAGGAVVAAADASAHRMLVAGGNGADNTPLDTCELYDAAADRWSTQEAHLPQPMCCHAAPITGGSTVLVVQLDDRKNTGCALLDVRSGSESWQPMKSPENARSFHAIAAVGEFSVVILGGKNARCGQTDSVQLYDVRADRWAERPEWRLPTLSSSHCTVVIE